MALDGPETFLNQKLRGPLHFTVSSTGSSSVNMMIKKNEMLVSSIFKDYMCTVLHK